MDCLAISFFLMFYIICWTLVIFLIFIFISGWHRRKFQWRQPAIQKTTYGLRGQFSELWNFQSRPWVTPFFYNSHFFIASLTVLFDMLTYQLFFLCLYILRISFWIEAVSYEQPAIFFSQHILRHLILKWHKVCCI